MSLIAGGVYFEASARENHEGVHAAFLHLCQEVGPYLSVKKRLIGEEAGAHIYRTAVLMTASYLAPEVLVIFRSTIL